MKKHIIKLKRLKACQEAIDYAKGFETLQDAWNACERGDWMLWLVGKQSGKPGSKKRKLLVLTACKCARLSLKYVAKGENRPLKAIETAEGWARGENTLDEVMSAASAANAASAASAAYASYAAAAASAAATAKKDTLKKCANIVRKNYPKI